MNASVPARFDREPQESAFGAGFRPLNLGIEWNADNQLKKVLKNSATIATFAYDPFGRRVEKVAGGTTTTFTYDGADILRETAGATTTYYVHGPGIDEPLAKEISGTATYYHADGLGSVLKMTSASGGATHEYRYDAYGRIEAGSSQGGYSFTGREWDSESGLFYYRARYFDPAVGRFISEDPIRFVAGLNFYDYVGNQPVNGKDPLGLFNFVKGGVGLFNLVRGGINMIQGAQMISATAPLIPTLEGAPFGLAGVTAGSVKLTGGAFLVKRGSKQLGEAIDDPCPGHLRNILGLLPFGGAYDDPGENPIENIRDMPLWHKIGEALTF